MGEGHPGTTLAGGGPSADPHPYIIWYGIVW